MKPPIFVRPLTPEEQDQLQASLHSADGFGLRRCQIILASSQSQTPAQIAPNVGRTPQTVRNVIHAFNQQGLASLWMMPPWQPCGNCCTRVPAASANLPACGPWNWRLRLQVSIETIGQALKRLGKSWRRAKHWINSPDPDYQRKKGPGTG
jgi:Winged helix-turn helix